MGSKSYRIRHIVQRLIKLKVISSMPSPRLAGVPADVPPGHVAVCVGRSCRRFIVRVIHLNHPALQKILDEAEEECGFDCTDGPLFFPCDESDFEEALRAATRSTDVPSSCRVVTESMPLLSGVSDSLLC